MTTRKDTKRITRDEIIALRTPRRSFSLCIYRRQGVQTVPLTPGVPLVIGREEPETGEGIVVDDESLSRRHARFTATDACVIVEDLNSRNGTWFLGEHHGRLELVSGDEVLLGRVPVVIDGGDPRGRAPRHLRHEGFRTMVEDEVARAQLFHRSLALVMLRASDPAAMPAGRLHPQIAALLRPIDRLAFYSADTLEVILPEVSREEAKRWIENAAGALHAQGAQLLAGAAIYPDAGVNAEALLSECRDALSAASATTPMVIAPASEEQEIKAPASEVILTSLPPAVLGQIAPSALTVLILGETGVGKDVIATQIHAASARRDKPFIVVNCAAIPEALVEGMLFGHEKGAFTGAIQRRAGFFEAAHRGTLMLDEIGDLPKPAQAALLRVLEAGKVRRVGATSETAVDVRVLAATHRDLEAMVREGAFREDLYHRLSGYELAIPPLRERRQEIMPLCQLFLDRYSRAANKRVAGLDDAAAALVMAYRWPGNVRELRNTLERAVAVCQGDRVTVADLPERLRAPDPSPARASLPPPPSLPLPPAPLFTSASPDPDAGEEQSLPDRLRAYETREILAALEAGGSTREAARLLDIPLRTLLHKMAALGIKRKPTFEPGAEGPKPKKPGRSKRKG